MGIYLLHFLKQHLTAFIDLVYWCGLEKMTSQFDLIFNEFFLRCKVPTLRGQTVKKHGGHWSISFLFID